MARFKPGTSGVRSDDSAKWATTTAQVVTDVAFYPIAVSECFYQISDRLPFETKSFSQTTFLRFSFFDRGGEIMNTQILLKLNDLFPFLIMKPMS